MSKVTPFLRYVILFFFKKALYIHKNRRKGALFALYGVLCLFSTSIYWIEKEV